MDCGLKTLLFFSCLCASEVLALGGTKPSQVFQIHSSGYNKCLTAITVSRFTVYGWRPTKNAALVLRDCSSSSSGQYWHWTPQGQIQSMFNQQCLAVTRTWVGYTGVVLAAAMQPCGSKASYQEWECTATGNYVKSKNINYYLVPFVNTGKRSGVQVSSTVNNVSSWNRFGDSKSLCENASQPTMSSTQSTSTGPVM